MSEQSRLPEPKPPLTAGGVVLLLIGAPLLLLPGGCSLFFSIGAIIDKFSPRRGGLDLSDLVLMISGAGFLVAALGFWMIRAGLRRRRPPSPNGV